MEHISGKERKQLSISRVVSAIVVVIVVLVVAIAAAFALSAGRNSSTTQTTQTSSSSSPTPTSSTSQSTGSSLSSSSSNSTSGAPQTLAIDDFTWPIGELNELNAISGIPFPNWLAYTVYQPLVTLNGSLMYGPGIIQVLPALA